MWVKLGDGISGTRTLFSAANYSLVYNRQHKRLRLQYGTSFNNVQLITQTNSIVPNTWTQIAVVYDGGTTGVASDQVNNYYNRFDIYINGTHQTTTNSNMNYGYNGTNNVTTVSFGDVDVHTASVAIWSSTRNQGGITTGFNSGRLLDYMTLAVKPRYYWYFNNDDVQQAGINLAETVGGSFSTDVPPS